MWSSVFGGTVSWYVFKSASSHFSHFTEMGKINSKISSLISILLKVCVCVCVCASACVSVCGVCIWVWVWMFMGGCGDSLMCLVCADTAHGIANDLLSAGLVDARNMIASE